MKICVYSLWHLGSVTAAKFAYLNHTVVDLDFDKKSICKLSYCKSIVFYLGLGSFYL